MTTSPSPENPDSFRCVVKNKQTNSTTVKMQEEMCMEEPFPNWFPYLEINYQENQEAVKHVEKSQLIVL